MKCSCEKNYEYHEIVDCITSALDARDPYTGHHSRRVSDMACLLCGYLGMGEEETQEIHIAGHLHDIGKIGIPDSVLLKSGRLDEKEWELMKRHPRIGAEILAKSAHFVKISDIILHHHERFDGTGYPFGTSGTEIPVGSRIVAVCDSIDAMASARAYRAAMPLEVCYGEIEKNIGKMYDPEIAEEMLRHWDVVSDIYGSDKN
ncbi:HD-GYP domain-containing protein [Treponema brennaborense]|uniref:Metal dependent phosphohydrolase n=1 Tax=Treponema brennaborense (strain DSM 12168 / CIP 105900 / DD5/3) TaxID=906968 RepID=F4LK01_TREBD|nr:HD-GYP domain-containing protein [Treponema brennaborense]AEE16481.1 metal dependent phosphohydrolase [Treponema brennaborense DSM 12168]